MTAATGPRPGGRRGTAAGGRRPDPVPDDVFLDELVFYELEPAAIDEYRRSEGHTTEKVSWPADARLRRIWTVFEFPETSRVAFVVAVWSVLMTLLSIILFCVETLPAYHADPSPRRPESRCTDPSANPRAER